MRIPLPECWIYQFRTEKAHLSLTQLAAGNINLGTRMGSVKSAHRRAGKVILIIESHVNTTEFFRIDLNGISLLSLLSAGQRHRTIFGDIGDSGSRADGDFVWHRQVRAPAQGHRLEGPKAPQARPRLIHKPRIRLQTAADELRPSARGV